MALIDTEVLKERITEDWFLDILLTQDGKKDMAKILVDMIDSVPLAYYAEEVIRQIEKANKKAGECG